MLELTEVIRASLERSLALGEDAEDREVFLGLSRIESERYHLLSDPQLPITPASLPSNEGMVPSV
jgi:hypothetical protein